jgi:branched-chain amino acid transport system ATP-binding protein
VKTSPHTPPLRGPFDKLRTDGLPPEGADPASGGPAPDRSAPKAPPILSTQNLQAFYGDAQALFGIDFRLHRSEVVAVIGANGAGKSTFLKSVTGLVPAARTSVTFDGEAIGGMHPGDIVRKGIAMVPEGRRLFASLSVEENLLMGATVNRQGPWNLERLFTMFPILKEKRHQPSGALSGGQQQMVSIGRALMSNPQVLLCDELSLGLAPIVIQEIYAALPAITADGMSVVLVEQDVGLAQSVSQRVVCLQEGKVSLEGRSDEVTRAQISEAYFGV